MQYYVPLGQETGVAGGLLLVRPRTGAAAFIQPLRRALRQLDPTFDYLDVATLQQAVEPQVRPWRLGAVLFGAFGVLAMVVASVGLYSVMSYVAAQRKHEMSVRIALGARARDIRRLILQQGLGAAAAGVVFGTALALAASRFVEPLLFDTSPRSAAVFGLVAALMMGVAVLASIMPAWRATRADPMVALRAE